VQSLSTFGISVSAISFYQGNSSNAMLNEFLFAYKITIQNHNDFSVKLLRRSWSIIQSDGQKRIVEGEGVLGIQPVIIPNATHQYLSGCNLNTNLGKMQGTYQMQNLNNMQLFTVQIPSFILIAPFVLN
jgi:ApaG protein